jgi:RHS repeat-associated protein
MRMVHLGITEIYYYNYDHVGRKTKFLHLLNGNLKTIAKYEYDGIGRLKSKKLSPSDAIGSNQSGLWTQTGTWQGGSLPTIADQVTINTGHTVTIPTGQTMQAGTLFNQGILQNFGVLQMGTLAGNNVGRLQTIDYNYHIRGGLRGINLDASGNLTNKLFSMKLGYEDDGNYFDGNIRKQDWKSSLDGLTRSYTYSYDGASRILSGLYGGGKPNENYSLENMSYDANGNILSLSRKGKTGTNSWGYIDQLSYVYQANSNKIQAVNDAVLVSNPNVGDFRDSSSIATQYTYNQDGSLNSDDNKKIIFEWNYLKSPKKITKANGQWKKFMYDANGKLLRTETSTGKTTDYVGNLTYENNVLYQISHEEGRINSAGQYEYDIYDHAKNLRVSFRDSSGIAKIATKLDYDPWGYRLKGLDYYNSSTYDKFKTFSGKELHEDFGFNLLSYKFRFHDPALGRFVSIDPLAEEYSHNSTFAFAENKLGLGMEYEGLEMVGFPIFGELPPIIEPVARPIIEPVTRLAPIENVAKVGEATTKTGEVSGTKSARPKFSPETLERFEEGRRVEGEQLTKHSYEKNNTPYKAIDPKTGKEGVTIPDAVKPDGGTVDVKNVKSQSFDKQLRIQNEISKTAGVRPELIINRTAKITQPVKNAFDIKYYSLSPMKIDNTRIQPSTKNISSPTSTTQQEAVIREEI